MSDDAVDLPFIGSRLRIDDCPPVKEKWQTFSDRKLVLLPNLQKTPMSVNEVVRLDFNGVAELSALAADHAWAEPPRIKLRTRVLWAAIPHFLPRIEPIRDKTSLIPSEGGALVQVVHDPGDMLIDPSPSLQKLYGVETFHRALQW